MTAFLLANLSERALLLEVQCYSPNLYTLLFKTNWKAIIDGSQSLVDTESARGLIGCPPRIGMIYVFRQKLY